MTVYQEEIVRLAIDRCTIRRFTSSTNQLMPLVQFETFIISSAQAH
jgi:hypothetical protein